MPARNSYRKPNARMKKELLAKNLNPVPKNGERNFFCPFYSECLDFAIKQSWKSWVCLECTHKMKQENDDHIFTYDFIPSCEIPAGIALSE